MPAARRRSWLRRFVRGVVGLGLLVFLLLALVLTFLHTPAGSTAARVIVEQWGSRTIGGPLRLGKLELSLWKGQAAATAASLSLEGVALDAQRVEIDWSRKAGLHVRLLRPRIVVRDTGEPVAKKPPATGLAAQPWRALEKLGKAEVEDGRLELRDAKGEPWLVLGRFDAEMVEDAGRRRLSVRIADAGVGWPEGGVRVRPATADATLALENGQLVVERARVVTGESSIDLHGRLDRISPITATASAGVALDGAFVEALAPGTDLAGRVEADATVEVKDDGLTGTLATTAPALTLKGLGPWAASGRGRFEGPRLVLESLEAKGYGGRLVAQGPLALSPSATDRRPGAGRGDRRRRPRRRLHDDRGAGRRARRRFAALGDDRLGRGGREGDRRDHAASGTPRAKAPGRTGPPPLRLRERADRGAHASRSRGWRSRRTARGSRRTRRSPPRAPCSGSWNATLPLASVNALLADLGSTARLTETYTGTLVAEGELAGPVSSPETERDRAERGPRRPRPPALPRGAGALRGGPASSSRR